MSENIIFVCTGNTCRSPMAEGFAKRERILGFNFLSRGVYVSSNTPSVNAIGAMNEYDIDISLNKPKMITEEDINSARLILTMTMAHKLMLLDKYSCRQEKIFTLSEFAFDCIKDVSDPYGLTLTDYKQCACEIKTYVDAAVKKLLMLDS